MLSNIFSQFIKRKFISAILFLLFVAGVGYFSYQKFADKGIGIQYVTVIAEQGTLISSILGSGQVSVSDQVDIKSKVSGELSTLYIQNGQNVNEGDIIAQIDTRDALKNIKEAELNLKNAQLSLEKMLSSGSSNLTQIEESYEQALEEKQESNDNLADEYDNGFNTIQDTFLILPSIIQDLENILFSKTNSLNRYNLDYYTNAWKFDSYGNPIGASDYTASQLRDSALNNFNNTKDAYNNNFSKYISASLNSSPKTTEDLLNETSKTVILLSEAVKSASDLILFYQNKLDMQDIEPSMLSLTHYSELSSQKVIVNKQLLSISSAIKNIEQAKKDIVNAQKLFLEKEEDLQEERGYNSYFLDIESQRLTVQSREYALQDSKEKLADHTIRAPFDGVAAKINVKQGNFISSSAILVVFITKQKIAEITLNEIDVAQIEIGQLATLTFDAVENLTLTGKVVEIDILGMVNQGVVTYNVKIAFDTQNEKIKPGMTVDASIITKKKDYIVLVPNAAVQAEGGQIFVDILENGIPQSVPIEVGLSNEISTEIVSGLLVGAEVITARLGSDLSSQTANIGQSFGGGIPGLGGSGGGFRGGGGEFGH